VADLRVFLDANILFTAAYSPEGLSALLIELGAVGRVTLLTSPIAIIEARRNLEVKRPAAVPAFERSLTAIEIVREPVPADVERLTPEDLSAKDRPILAAAIVARATHFVTGDQRHYGRWMTRRTSLPFRVMTPRQFLTEVRP
jgi:predicted nucleic acid-binding protein